MELHYERWFHYQSLKNNYYYLFTQLLVSEGEVTVSSLFNETKVGYSSEEKYEKNHVHPCEKPKLGGSLDAALECLEMINLPLAKG